MGMPQITTFCCWCLGLEQGAKFIAYMHMIISVLTMVVCSVLSKSGDSSWYTTAVVVAVVSAAHALLAAFLQISVSVRWWRGVRAWAWVMEVQFAAALMYVMVAAPAAACRLSGSGSNILLAFLVGLVLFGTLAYCILCVHSYYLLLRSADDMQGPAKPAEKPTNHGSQAIIDDDRRLQPSMPSTQSRSPVIVCNP